MTAMNVVPVLKPSLPTADEIMPYLRRIDEARYYSNHGPLVREFEQRLAAHFNVDSTQVTTASNGTVALSAALLAVGAPAGSRCLLPSWTFVASAAAVWAAHMRPHFVDVDADTWMLDPIALRARMDLGDVGAVMVVAPFGAPVDVAAWDAFTAETGIPVVIDAAAAFDAAKSMPISRPGRSPMMISFHATKAFGIGEGAVIISTADGLAKRMREHCNFGFSDGLESESLGYNGKLSEYHAALGLAALNAWDARRAVIARLTAAYVERLGTVEGVRTSPGYGLGWVSCYCNILIDEPATAAEARLHSAGIETRRWWRRGVHVQPAYQDVPRDALPKTEALADHVIGIPFYHDLSDANLERVVRALGAESAVRV